MLGPKTRYAVVKNEYKIVRRFSSLCYAIFEILLQVVFQFWFIIGQEISQSPILDGVDSIHSKINSRWIPTPPRIKIKSTMDTLREK